MATLVRILVCPFFSLVVVGLFGTSSDVFVSVAFVYFLMLDDITLFLFA